MAERDPSEEAPLTEANSGSSGEDDTHSWRGEAWINPNLRWKKDRLKVHVMKAVPSIWPIWNWTGTNIPVTMGKVLEWANAWSSEALDLKGIVPQFVEEEDIDKSDVRVKFTTSEYVRLAYQVTHTGAVLR